MCFDRNIIGNTVDKILECDYLSFVTVHETHFALEIFFRSTISEICTLESRLPNKQCFQLDTPKNIADVFLDTPTTGWRVQKKTLEDIFKITSKSGKLVLNICNWLTSFIVMEIYQEQNVKFMPKTWWKLTKTLFYTHFPFWLCSESNYI
jgi:hypothetical protein